MRYFYAFVMMLFFLFAPIVQAQVDSDGDGISDEIEMMYGLDPYDPQDAMQDLDGDGVSNFHEILLGTPPNQNDDYRSFFTLASSDSDIIIGGAITLFKQAYVADVITFSFAIEDIHEGLQLQTIECDNPYFRIRREGDQIFVDYFVHQDGEWEQAECTLHFHFVFDQEEITIPVGVELDIRLYQKPEATVDLEGLPTAVALSKQTLYVANFDDAKINLYDISDPKNIRFIKSFTIGEATITDIFIDNQRMYAALGSEGIAIIDISNPTDPRVVRVKETGREYWDIFGQSMRDGDFVLGEEFIYAIDNKAGLLDIFDGNLNLVKSVPIESSLRTIRIYVASEIVVGYSTIRNRYLFVSNPEKGLFIYRASADFNEIETVGTYTNFSPSDVRAINDTMTYSVDGEQYTIHGVFASATFIIFGSKSFYCYGSLSGLSDLQEITDVQGRAINSSGEVENRYGGLWGGDYSFKEIDSEGVRKSIATHCFGPIVSTPEYLFCANKNSEVLELYSIQERKGLPMVWGWNLLALPGDEEVNMTNFVDVPLVWRYSDGSWQGWSSDADVRAAIAAYGIEQIERLQPGEGFWVFCDEPNILYLAGNGYGMERVELRSGWNLVGLGEDMDASLFVQKVQEEYSKSVEALWSYSGGRWSLWKDGEDYQEYGIGRLDTVKSGEGFWAFVQ